MLNFLNYYDLIIAQYTTSRPTDLQISISITIISLDKLINKCKNYTTK